MSKPNSLGRLELTAFLSGAAVMVFEITGSRVLAPYLGTSLFVWTTLIGVIMASLSLGYWWGGRLADREPSYARLGAILVIAGGLALFTAVAQQSVLSGLQQIQLELRLTALAATLVLFAPASVLLGMVTPYVARLKLQSIETAGAHVGRLYAISTAGSIVGTFAAGYFLMAYLGTSRILYLVAISLIVLSLIVSAQWRIVERSALIVFAVLAGLLGEYERVARAEAGLLDLDTSYQRVFVIDTTDKETGRPVRILRSEDENTQSAIFLDSAEPVGDYLRCFTKVFDSAGLNNGETASQMLMIGAAGYAYPRYLLQQIPGMHMDVVEIDPAMTEIATQFFQLQPTKRMQLFHEDGRTFVNRSGSLYDIAFIDAFQTRVPPFQLLTVEFVQRIADRLRDRGSIALNLIATPGDRHNGLAAAIASTYRKVLPHVSMMQVDGSRPLDERQNLVLWASKAPIPAPSDSTARKGPCAILDAADLQGLVLTDDFAPVEQLVD